MNKWVCLLIVSVAFVCESLADSQVGHITRSVAGIMDKLSCHCVNGAYFHVEGGVDLPVCFSEAVKSELECKNLKLYGETKEHLNAKDSGSPCVVEGMDIFFVEKSECL